jgi:hypothetical protein
MSDEKPSLPKMKKFDLIPISEEWKEYYAEKERKHAEVVLRGPVNWNLNLSAYFDWPEGSGVDLWTQSVDVTALYAREAVEAISRVLPEAFDDAIVRVVAVGPDGSETVFEIDTEVTRTRTVSEQIVE